VGAIRTGGFSNRFAITHNKPKSVARLLHSARQDRLNLADTAKNLRGGAHTYNTRLASAGGRRNRNFCIFIKPFVLVDAGFFINPPNAKRENVRRHF